MTMAMMRDLANKVGPPGFPELSRLQAAMDNVLAAYLARLAIPVAGERQEVRLAPAGGPVANETCAALAIGASQGALGFTMPQIAAFLPDLPVQTDLEALPPVLADAVVGTAFSPALETLTQFFDARPVLTGKRATVPGDWAAIDLKPRDKSLAGTLPRLYLDPTAADAAMAFIRAKLKPRQRAWAADLPVALEAALASVRLPVIDLQTIRQGDVIVLDPHTAMDRAVLLSASNGRAVASGTLSDQTVHIDTLGEASVMSEEEAPGTDGAEETIDINEVSVSISFVAGQKTLTVSELQALSIGTTIELDQRGLGEVSIRSAGSEIGRGEFVKIDDRLGVRVLSVGLQKDG